MSKTCLRHEGEGNPVAQAVRGASGDLRLRPGADVDLLVREVGLVAVCEHEGARQIAQANRSCEVGAVWLDRRAYDAR